MGLVPVSPSSSYPFAFLSCSTSDLSSISQLKELIAKSRKRRIQCGHIGERDKESQWLLPHGAMFFRILTWWEGLNRNLETVLLNSQPWHGLLPTMVSVPRLSYKVNLSCKVLWWIVILSLRDSFSSSCLGFSCSFSPAGDTWGHSNLLGGEGTSVSLVFVPDRLVADWAQTPT